MSWPVIARDVLGEGHVSSFVNETIEVPTGELIERQYLTHPGAVAVVAWREETDDIAVLRQYRHPVRAVLVEIPAGLLDHGDDEAYVVAAQRELAEEVALAADRWEVLVDICTTPGACEETLRIFLARDLRPTSRPEGFELEGEEAQMTWGWEPRADLVDAVLAGTVVSPSLCTGILALETARLSGFTQKLRPADAPWPIRER
ncbi:ADP-ribose pyrophosphatase [Tessaracoccus bendigoensis DSM 12906]|uniref:ADP-ribose pyrophosphatase n=2 Tax=Tessaracoccus TaxID=72763 RepID=A0A1M6LJB0_9ACTN|nr:NUDIX hydrolase [Tessaracoccus bendigoensis]SHJ71273.1 ADP-ribose pyrophosphatase [Tessaracoccus bendigoensis DSM 12906]